MSTRNRFRRKSRKQLLKGGGAPAWHFADPPKSFKDLVSEFRPIGTNSKTGYALDADLVADYYWNKAMTQVVFIKNMLGKETEKQKIITASGEFGALGGLTNKGNSKSATLIEKAKKAAKTEHAKKMKTNVFPNKYPPVSGTVCQFFFFRSSSSLAVKETF